MLPPCRTDDLLTTTQSSHIYNGGFEHSSLRFRAKNLDNLTAKSIINHWPKEFLAASALMNHPMLEHGVCYGQFMTNKDVQ